MDSRHNTCRQGMAFAENIKDNQKNKRDNQKMITKLGLSMIAKNRLLKKNDISESFSSLECELLRHEKIYITGCSKENLWCLVM